MNRLYYGDELDKSAHGASPAAPLTPIQGDAGRPPALRTSQPSRWPTLAPGCEHGADRPVPDRR